MKRLIVNADDWGLTRGVNRGVLRAFQEGIVTSASLLVTGSAFEDAVAQAREVPELDCGLHLALVEERAVLSRDALPSLVDDAGRLPRTSGKFFARAITGRINWNEVEREIAAQIARFRETGLRLSHIDSHQHLHMFPPVFQIVSRLIRDMDNVWLRNSAGAWGKPPGARTTRWMQKVGLNLSCLWVRCLHNPPTSKMPDGMLGFEAAGCLSRAALRQILRELPDGLHELNCHPGEADAETQSRYGHWNYQGPEELEALIAVETRRLLEDEGIELTSFARVQRA